MTEKSRKWPKMVKDSCKSSKVSEGCWEWMKGRYICYGLSIITQFRNEIGRTAERRRVLEVCWQMSVTQFVKKSVEAAGRCGVVRNALSSPRWRSPGWETSG